MNKNEMKRQDINGRPIYKDSLWERMKETGNILIDLGYSESYSKPNLFFKVFAKDEIIFADLRGTKGINQ